MGLKSSQTVCNASATIQMPKEHKILSHRFLMEKFGIGTGQERQPEFCHIPVPFANWESDM